jgi:hypothetical protein
MKSESSLFLTSASSPSVFGALDLFADGLSAGYARAGVNGKETHIGAEDHAVIASSVNAQDGPGSIICSLQGLSQGQLVLKREPKRLSRPQSVTSPVDFNAWRCLFHGTILGAPDKRTQSWSETWVMNFTSSAKIGRCRIRKSPQVTPEVVRVNCRAEKRLTTGQR